MSCKVAAMNCYEKEINELELRIKDLKKKSERIDKRKKFGFFYPDVDEPYYVYAVDEIMDFERDELVPESDEFFEYCYVYKTKEQCQWAEDKVRQLRKLIALRNAICPDYEPNWDDESERKHFVYYDYEDSCWRVNTSVYFDYNVGVYFDTWENAQKAADFLNDEIIRE
ncbi:MAG TPA: hypothetical protein DCW90_23440 [Lachnospiraceae bacterium]|mgnify:CR=1 FL=1|nr:hypothetical protein [Lachnospiraceae bacterium]